MYISFLKTESKTKKGATPLDLQIEKLNQL